MSAPTCIAFTGDQTAEVGCECTRRIEKGQMNRVAPALKIISVISAIAVIGAAYFFLFSLYVPFNMDEFLSYHVLACYYYPLNKLNTFTQACRCHDLAPFGNYYLPIRSNLYVGGSLLSLVYYPLFKLWPSPYSARLLVLIFLFLQAFILHRIFRVNLLLSFILLLFCMPYAFQHMVDTGPIIFHTISIFLVYYLMQRWKLSLKGDSHGSWNYPALIGIVLFLGIYLKLAYFFILPSILILLGYCFFWDEPALGSLLRLKRVKIGGHVLLLIATLCVPSLILLNSRDRDNDRYYSIITRSEKIGISEPGELLSHFWDLCRYLTDPFESAQRIFICPGARMPLGGMLLAGTIIALLIYGITQCRKKGIGYGFIIVNILLFFLALVLMAKTKEEVLMHHVVLCFPFIILAIFYIYSRFRADRFVVWMVAVFLMVNLSLYWHLTTFRSHRYSHPSNARVINLIHERYSNEYVIVIVDWGLYFMQALYGDKNQCVIWIEQWDSREKNTGIKEVLHTTNRKAFFVGFWDSQQKWNIIKQRFPDLVQLKTDIDTGEWIMWYQP